MNSNYHELARFLASAKNGHDRPLEHATRVHWQGYAGEGEQTPIAIQHHSTDIVTILPNGRKKLANGGWYSVTTLQRLRAHGSRHIISNRGDWLIPIEHDPNDPPPQLQTDREIPKPFHASDPGPEPIDDGEGCRVGEVEVYDVQEDRTIYNFQRDNPLDLGRGFPLPPDDWNREQGHVEVRLTRMHAVEYGEKSYGGYHPERKAEYKQCSHCEAFQAKHAAWERAYEGRPYAGRERERYGHRQMCELLETYGSREAWQDAYITEFREVRENRKALKEWESRNRVEFYGGIEVTADGYVPLKAKRQHEKDLRRQRRERAAHNRRVREHEAKVRKIMARAEERKRVKRQIAQALAESIVVSLETARPGWREMVANNRTEVAA